MYIYGIVLLEDGSIIFNFELLGFVCMDVCGYVVWRFFYLIYYVVYLDEEGRIWVLGVKVHTMESHAFPNHIAPFWEPTILTVGQGGKVQREISMLEVLQKGDLQGLL